MNQDDRDELLAELIEEPARRADILRHAGSSESDREEVLMLAGTADLLWESDRAAPPLMEDRVAAVLGLVSAPHLVSGSNSRQIEALRRLPCWKPAMKNLRALLDEHGPAAEERARGFGRIYQGARGAMVVDVVMSAQRRYPRVAKICAPLRDRHYSLRNLMDHPPTRDELGLRRHEASAMVNVAQGLLRYADEHGIAIEDDACAGWAQASAGFSHAYECDPYCGNLRGIRLTLYCYLVMLSGGDAIKPDGRVAAKLASMGFPVGDGRSPHATLAVAHAAAAELNVGLLVLDQLLWWGVTDDDA